MEFKLTSNDAFAASFTEMTICEGITLLHISAKAVGEAAKLELTLKWECDDIGVFSHFSPMSYRNKTIQPDWGGGYGSSAMSSAPVSVNIGADDTNRMTIACSDAKNGVSIKSGVIEETARLINQVTIRVDCFISDYAADVRIDTRAIPFSKAIDDVAAWWESYPGYEPIKVPDDARRPLYSAWYSFHQQIDVPAIVKECEYFSALGCKVLIVDDGWQTDDNNRGYAYCGDWKVTPNKIPDMKAFVDAVHETGMKFVLWYSVPFVGEHSEAFKRFEGKFLPGSWNGTYTLDPRYPEVREYLIGIYRNAVLDWGLDGFKLDFIDSFHQCADVKDGMDYISVFDAVDRLMKDIMRELTALNPEILIEFRQSYIGPLMRSFGNMLRSADCPNDSLTNRLNTLSLRLFARSTAVHSDMVMWNYSEPVEMAAYQLTNVLFSVPQISVRHDKMPESHAKMVKCFLDLWTKYRNVLLDGEMTYKNYASDFTYVSSKLGETQVGAVYAGRIAEITEPTDEIVLVNASADKDIIIDAPTLGRYNYTVADCMGKIVERGGIIANEPELTRIAVPINGTITLNRIK